MEYEGLIRAEAEDRASANSVEFVRVVDLDQSEGIALRPDLRARRLNLLVHHGLVARAGFG
jgi:hypothetical protein